MEALQALRRITVAAFAHYFRKLNSLSDTVAGKLAGVRSVYNFKRTIRGAKRIMQHKLEHELGKERNVP